MATHYAYLEFYPVAQQILDDTLRVLPVDSLTESALHDIATLETSLPGAYARNILIVSGDTAYQEPIIFPDEGLKQSKRIKFRGVKVPETNRPFTVFPNPADSYLILKTELPVTETSGIVRVIDRKGSLVKSIEHKGSKDETLIDIKDLPPGLYLIEVRFENGISGIIKLVVI